MIVEGEDGYKAARGFMKLLMPSHVRRVKQHTETDAAVPALRRRGPAQRHVPAGRPAEVGRLSGHQPDRGAGLDRHQLGPLDPRAQYRADRLRDQPRGGAPRSPASCACATWPASSSSTSSTWSRSSHVRKVEKAMKEALKNDRARIQVGRISSFGLMEMSRQRLRTGVLEASTKACPHCEGTGLMRTASSAGLSRAADDRGRGRARPRRQDRASRRPRGGGLRAQQEARRAGRDRAALRRVDRGR